MGDAKQLSGGDGGAAVTPVRSLREANKLLPVPKRTGTARARSRRILGLDQSKLPHSEQVFGTLRWAVSCFDNGREEFLFYVYQAQMAGSEVAKAFWEKYTSLTVAQRLSVDLDDVAESMEISVPNLVGTVVSIMVKQKRDYCKLITAQAMPDVLKNTVECAKKSDADFFPDRKLMLEIGGLAPTRGKPGRPINVNVQQNNSNDASVDSSGMPNFEHLCSANARVVSGDE